MVHCTAPFLALLLLRLDLPLRSIGNGVSLVVRLSRRIFPVFSLSLGAFSYLPL